MTAAAAVKTAVGMSTQFCAGWPTMHGTCRAAVNQKAGAGVAEAAVEGVVEVGSVAEGHRRQRRQSLDSELPMLGAHFK